MAASIASQATLVRNATARSSASRNLLRPRNPLRVPFSSNRSGRSAGIKVATQAKSFDFDEVLQGLSDKFDKSDNKPVVIGYSVGAVIAFIVLERIINAPVLNIILGWPLQTLGLLLTPYLAVRYLNDGEDWYADATDVADKVTQQLPGLKK